MQGRRLLWTLIAFTVVGCCLIGALSIVVTNNVARQVGPNLLITDEATAAAIGHEIVDYDLPPDYYEQVASSLGYKMVAIGSAYSDMTIMLMQFPDMGTSREEMERQMQIAMAGQRSSGDVIWENVAARSVTIKGAEVVLTVQTGTSARRSAAMRRELGVFQGKDGVVMLMVLGSQAEWDAEGLDQFLASIR